MISKKYSSMLNNTSIIREFAQYASKRAAEIGAECVQLYYRQSICCLPQTTSTRDLSTLSRMRIHWHFTATALHLPSVRKAVAESLNRRFGMEYVPEDIFMTSGAAGALAHAIRCVTEPGDEVITFAPSSLSMYHTLSGTGAVLKVDSRGHNFIPDRL